MGPPSHPAGFDVVLPELHSHAAYMKAAAADPGTSYLAPGVSYFPETEPRQTLQHENAHESAAPTLFSKT